MVDSFFGDISQMIDQAERQYGLANRSYTEYVIDRLEFAIIVCSDLRENLRDVSGLEDYYSSVEELIDAVKNICKKWEEYEDVLDASLLERPPSAYHSHVIPGSGPGRPRFKIDKEQLLYLSSLGFSWTEIAVLLGVSRMTIYRCVAVGIKPPLNIVFFLVGVD